MTGGTLTKSVSPMGTISGMDTVLVITHLAAALGGIILGWTMRDRRHG